MTELHTLTLRDLRRAEPLIRRKEKLLAKLQGINRQLDSFCNGRINGHSRRPPLNVNGRLVQNWKSGPERAGRTKLLADVQVGGKTKWKLTDKRTAKQPRKGTVLWSVLFAMRESAAGAKGASVPELAKATRLRPTQVQGAIHMNRKRYPGIQRVGRGRYRYVA